MGLFEHKIQQFPEIIEWAKSLNVEHLSEFLLNDKDINRIFLASGGSYSAAAYAELLSTKNGIMAHAMTPFFYGTSGYELLPAKMMLVSASGANLDVYRAFEKGVLGKAQTVGAMTLTSIGRLQEMFGKKRMDTLFAFDIPTGRDGFLSTNTVLSFYILLYRSFGYTDIDKLTADITAAERKEIEEFVGHLKHISTEEMTKHEAWLHKLEGVDSFFILYTGKSYPAALDIESKFSEGAVGNTQLADYRNFAHGRYNWFTQRPGQTGLICLQTPEDVDLSEETLSKLPIHVPILRLKTKHSTPLGVIDLLIKEHYLCSALGARWGLDLSRPTVPEYGKALYRM